MATAEQIKNLIKSHYSENTNRFNTLVLQLAASEARKGNTKLARDIKSLLEDQTYERNKIIQISKNEEFIDYKESNIKLNEMVLPDDLKEKINRIVKEYKNSEILNKHGLSPKRKILLSGDPGTGKTMTASVLANSLSLPLGIIYTDKLTTKYMGETTTKLRQVFESIEKLNGVYLFDEFDAIGGERYRDNDVGEMRRVLNTFLQLIEGVKGKSLVLAATNSIKTLDKALYRRFDDILFYKKPQSEEIVKLFKNHLGNLYAGNKLNVHSKSSIGLSHSEIVSICNDVLKECILEDKNEISDLMLAKAIESKKIVYSEV